MKICGLQKTTLIDYPDQIGCTIFLYGCNFRCGFCYNAELVTESPQGIFSEGDVLSFLDKRKDKLEAVCITGGEPLLTLDKIFLQKIKDMGYLIKIDTNGTNPEKLKNFIQEKLVDYVAMDIKGSKEDYSSITQSPVQIEKIEETIKLIVNLENYEFRTTILKEFHNVEKIKSIGIWLNELINQKPKKYFLQGFKNQGNFIDKKYTTEENTPEDYLKQLKTEADKYFQEVQTRW